MNGVLGGLAGFVVLVGIGLAIWFAALKPGAKAASPPAHPKPPAAGNRRFSLQVCGDFANGICINPGLSRSADDKQFVAVETVTNVHGGDTARFVLKDPDTASTLAESNTLRAQRAFRTFYFTDTIGNNGKPLGARRIEVIVYFNGGLLKPSVTVEFR